MLFIELTSKCGIKFWQNAAHIESIWPGLPDGAYVSTGPGQDDGTTVQESVAQILDKLTEAPDAD